MKNQEHELAEGLTMTDDIIQIYCECKKHRIKPNSNIHEESTRTFKRDNLGFILIECPHRMLLLKIEQHLNLRKLKQDKQLAMPKKILKLVEDVYSLTKPINLKTLLY